MIRKSLYALQCGQIPHLKDSHCAVIITCIISKQTRQGYRYCLDGTM
uniref:Uncharacterized protein n=1 Tax=Arundo donax TaxID=35708 RepID=A0A0A9HHQ2_ARUDO